MSHANACILDAHGKKVKQLTVRGAWSRVIGEPAKLQGNLSVCYEASRGYGCLYDQLGTPVRRVVVARPGRLRPIPGVGLRTAETTAAYVHDPKRPRFTTRSGCPPRGDRD